MQTIPNRPSCFLRVDIALCPLILFAATFIVCEPAAAQPAYSIIDIGLIPGEITIPTGMSAGGVATGYTIGVFPPSVPSAFYWTQAGGRVNLPNLLALNINRLPVIWQSGVATQLPLPAGQTLGSRPAERPVPTTAASPTPSTPPALLSDRSAQAEPPNTA